MTVDSIAFSSLLATWVTAAAGIGAVVTALVVVTLQNRNAGLDKRQDKIERRKLALSVLVDCKEAYIKWRHAIDVSPSIDLAYRANGLRHFDVPLEQLITADFGNVEFNKAMIAMRRINADVWFQINLAKELFEKEKAPDLAYYSRSIDSIINEVSQREDQMKGQMANWP